MEKPVERWQVDLEGKVVETDFETIKHWIAEGRITIIDKVRKGDLNWIAAGRVPSLRAHFQQVQHGGIESQGFESRKLKCNSEDDRRAN